jgi:hypothetical protein
LVDGDGGMFLTLSGKPLPKDIATHSTADAANDGNR